MLKFKIGWWGLVGLTILYLYIMSLYFHHVMSTSVDEILQIGATFLALVYTVFQVKLIVNKVMEFFNVKEGEKND